MSQGARPTLASKGCGQPRSLSLCKDHPASSREAQLGPAPRSPGEWAGWGCAAALAPGSPRPSGRWARTEACVGAGPRPGSGLWGAGSGTPAAPPAHLDVSPGRIYVMVFMGSRHARCTRGAGRPPPVSCPAQEALTRDCGALWAVGSRPCEIQ